MIVRKITPQELSETRKISAICFEYPYEMKDKTEEEYLKEMVASPTCKEDKYFLEKWAAFTDDNKMMSSFLGLPYTVYFDGNQMKSVGIGAVSTYPHHRRKGAVRECFNKALPDIYEDGVDFSYLYPFSEMFYANFGYQRSCNSICWKFGLSTIPDYRFPGTFHLYESEEDMDGFKEAYNGYAKNFNMMIARDEYDWDKLKNAKAYANNNYAYLYRDSDGTPKGYLIFKREVRNQETILNCSDVVFQDFETLKALMSFARSYGTDFRAIRFYAPSCFSLEYFCKDFSQSYSSMNIGSNGMVRVINVKNVLKNAKYNGSGEFSIKITDSQIKQNNGIFTVVYENGSAKDVTFLECTDGTVDLECTINFFSAAIVGNYDVEDFDYMEGLKINCTSDKLNQVFYKKPCFINNYF